MKTKITSISILALLLTATGAFAQGGLYSIGQNLALGEEFEAEIPLTWTVGASGGWDSNMNSASVDKQESWYLNGGLGVVYGLMRTKTTSINLGGNYSAIYYLDAAPGTQEWDHNARGNVSFVHRATPRLTIVNHAYLTYEVEPDFAVGASAARRADQYLYGYNNFAVSYSWTRRLSTVTGYTLSGIRYDEEPFKTTENRLTHIASNQFRYMLDRQTTLTADYRFIYTDFRSIPRNPKTHVIYGGLDHVFSPYLSGSLSVGAQINDDIGGTNARPAGEFALTYRASEDTTLRWANYLGYENNELAGFDTRYSFRSGLTANHRLTPYLSVDVGGGFFYSDFEGISGVTTGINEHAVSASLGLNFRILDNTDLSARYYFTKYSSDDAFRDYDRHRVSLGVVATF